MNDFTRRQFLAASTAAVCLGGASHARADVSFKGRIRKAVKFHMVQDDSLSVQQKFELLKELGYDGTEIRTQSRDDKETYKAASDATGLPIHGVINSSNPDIRGAVDLSEYYGGTSVLVVAGRVNEKIAYDDNWDEWLNRIREAAPYAEDHGIKLLVENVWNNFLLSPLEMARFIDEIDHEAVGVYFDVGNVVRFGWPDQWIRILGNRIGKLDIKEYSRKLQLDEGLWKGFQVEIGEGDCGWPAVRAALDEISYEGWATAEVPGGAKDRLAEIARRMDNVLALNPV
ncbi:MAG: sugar phosphate isomerase/epimerase [Planctomycetaceae bacterium]|nr:sugar phosphate isomerase/epimerase [Planctomycetaceae bacterium]